MELRIEDGHPIDATANGGLFTRQFPHLRVLTFREFTRKNPEVASKFWSSHSLLERLALPDGLGDAGWFEGLNTGCLPKLQILDVSNLFSSSLPSVKFRRHPSLTQPG